MFLLQHSFTLGGEHLNQILLHSTLTVCQIWERGISKPQFSAHITRFWMLSGAAKCRADELLPKHWLSPVVKYVQTELMRFKLSFESQSTGCWVFLRWFVFWRMSVTISHEKMTFSAIESIFGTQLKRQREKRTFFAFWGIIISMHQKLVNLVEEIILDLLQVVFCHINFLYLRVKFHFARKRAGDAGMRRKKRHCKQRLTYVAKCKKKYFLFWRVTRMLTKCCLFRDFDT